MAWARPTLRPSMLTVHFSSALTVHFCGVCLQLRAQPCSPSQPAANTTSLLHTIVEIRVYCITVV